MDPILLLPRLYQAEVVEHAVERNTIVRMDTGTGKTLVAIMLIRHITSLPTPPGDPPSLVVCIVPTVNLVTQQSAAIAGQTNLRVKGFSGSMGVDYWKREEWVKEFNAIDVVVCTAQIWLNVLNNAYWDMERISLLILDEAHHAKKNNPYCRIMKDHYHRIRESNPRSRLPRILGLTASPIWNPKSPEKSIKELEENLHARLVEVKLHLDSVNAFANKPKERLIEFALSLGYASESPTAFENGLRGLAPAFTLDEKTWTNIDLTKQRLGSFASNLFIVYILEALLSNEGPRLFGNDASHQAARANQSLLRALHSRLSPLLAASPLDSTTLSPHVETLLFVLAEFKARNDFHSIVFVQRRQDAQLLAAIVERVEGTRQWLKPGWLVGHGGRGGAIDEERLKDIGMEIKQQAETVASFRSGQTNILFATQVAEEGLDFRACNVVIRFDPLQTITGYIQSRGRARPEASEFIVMAERDSLEANVYREYVAKEPILEQMYGERPVTEADEPELDNLPTYVVPSTGAILTYQSAIPLLSEFCSLLPTDPFAAAQKPEFEITGVGLRWKATLRLPMIAALPGKRVVVGFAMATKKASKQAAAFEICVELHAARALDDHLLPIRERLGGGGKDTDGRDVGSSPTPDSVPTSFTNVFGNVWIDDSDIWLHAIEIEDAGQLSTVGLLAGTNLESFVEGRLFDTGPTRELVVRLKSARLLSWNGDERKSRLEQLRTLNLGCLQVVVNRRIGTDSHLDAMWTLLRPDGDIDWDAVRMAFVPASTSSLEEGDLVVVPCRRLADRLFTFVKRRDDVTTLSPSADVVLGAGAQQSSAIKGRAKLLLRYPAYFIFTKVAYDFHDVSETVPDSIITLRSLPSHPQNHLTPATAAETNVSHTPEISHFPSSMCKLANLPSNLWIIFRMSPSLLRLVHDNLRVHAAIRHFHLPPIDIQLLLRALTPPSALTGFDYQTLETLGDSVLKVATTVHVYLEHPGLDEGRMSVLRQNSVDNRFLRQRSLATGFSSFLLPERFQTSTWIPPTLEDGQLSSDGLSITRNVGRRALADTIEATLGAAYLSGGLEMALETGDRLGLCFGGTKPWSERASARELGGEPTTTPPGLQLLEAKLGYVFKNARLLLQALTHRSYTAAETHCYEREEHVGDAILEFWAAERLITLFPTSTPRNISFLRALLVSNPALAFLSLRILDAHRNVLHASAALDAAMQEAAAESASFEWKQVLEDLTRVWDPPKVLGDVFEAISGAVFIDAGFELAPVFEVLDRAYAEVLPLLRDVETRDPHSRLLMFADAIHCTKLFNKSSMVEGGLREATCTFHDTLVSSHTSSSATISRQLSAHAALELLQSSESAPFLAQCTCKADLEAAKREKAQVIEGAVEEAAVEERMEDEEEDSRKRIFSETIIAAEEEEGDAMEGGEEVDGGSPPQRVRTY